MADVVTSIEQSDAVPDPPSSLMTVATLFCISLGGLLEGIQTTRNPTPLRLTFALAYLLAAIFAASYAVRRTYLNMDPPVRWKKGDRRILFTRIFFIPATLLMMGFVAGNLVPSAGPTWKGLADDAFPWVFVLNFQPDYLTEHLPLPPPWPQTLIGRLWVSMRRILSGQRADATQP